VKAANILVTRGGDIKVADFGVSETLSQAIEGEVAGSPLWMAPEVCLRKKYDYTADIWSAGITAIELVDGDPPLSDLSTTRVMMAIPRNSPPTVSDESSISADYLDFIQNMLVKEPSGRAEIAVLLQHTCCQNALKSDFQLAIEEVVSFTESQSSSSKNEKNYHGTLISLTQAQAQHCPGISLKILRVGLQIPPQTPRL